MHRGDYAAAISDFNDFLTAHPDHPLAAEARFELAQAWLAAQNVGQAIPILEALAQDDGVIARYPEILYWLGRAYEASDKQKAAAAFLQYADHSQQLKADALLAAADAYLADQDVMAAVKAYARALDVAPDLATALRAREGIAAAHLLDRQPDAAIEQYQAILAVAKAPAYRAEIAYRLGMALLDSGKPADAWRSFHRAMAEDKTSWYAYQALIQLVDAEQPVAPRLRAEVDVNAGAYYPAIAILTQLLMENPDDAGALQALLARAYEGVGDDAAAAEAWRQALTAADAETKNRAWLGLGRSLWRRGLREDARLVYLQAAEQAADADVAATALWQAAVLAGQDNDKWLQAADDFMRLARHFPDSDYADQAGFRAGLIHYRLVDAETARALWTEHAAAGDSPWRAAAHYWLGKLLRQTDGEEAALAHWRETARRWGEDDFYGVRARQQLQAAGVAYAVAPTPASRQADGLAEATAWVAKLAGKDMTALQQTPPEFARIAELHRVGEERKAHRELETLRRAWKNAPIELLQTALFARDLGYYDIAIRAASQLVINSKQPLTAAPRTVQELVYPLYYRDLMLDSARTFDLDPALFYALIRQESLFWAPAASAAGAKGLAQIMPATGQAAARQLALDDFTLSDLLRPRISVYMGAYILSEELRRSDGNVFRALAAYNAGPGNAAFWWELAAGDADLFAELISFRETQHYVRTITIQAHLYRRLYPDLQ